jgi:hypothetical protein
MGHLWIANSAIDEQLPVDGLGPLFIGLFDWGWRCQVILRPRSLVSGCNSPASILDRRYTGTLWTWRPRGHSPIDETHSKAATTATAMQIFVRRFMLATSHTLGRWCRRPLIATDRDRDLCHHQRQHHSLGLRVARTMIRLRADNIARYSIHAVGNSPP